MSQPVTSQQNKVEGVAPPAEAIGCVDWVKRCQDLTEERDKLQKELAKTKQEIAVERDQLLKELASVQGERDIYLRSLYALTHEEFDFDKDELLASMGKGKPLMEFIQDLERMPGA